jgi:putative glycosyltransferase (TIGR04372 family)
MTPRFFSDLTDVQWDRVRSAAFPDRPDPDPLRRVVDALLFRERAMLPWAVMPTALPAADELRRHAAEWADGTWARVKTAILEPQTTAPSITPPVGLRHRIARLVRSVPGGGLALRPARAAIRFVQYVRARNTPHRRLPALFRHARVRLDAHDYAAAAESYTRLLDVDPFNSEGRTRLGDALHRLGRNEEARDQLLTALSLPHLASTDRHLAHHYLSQVYLALGDLDRAVGHAYLLRLLRRYGDYAPWDQDDLAEGPDEFEALCEVHNELAEFAINFHSDFAAAAALYDRRDEARRGYERWLATVPPETLFLPLDWVRNVGHIALIDFWLKMRELGWLDRRRIVVHAPPDRTANRAYLGCYKPHLRVVADCAPDGAARHFAAAFGPHVASVLRIPGVGDKYFLEGMGAIQEEWERQGRGPLLSLSAEDQAFGRAKLREMGVPGGAWFVALHVRSPGFHGESTQGYQDHRNADVATYLPLIREVVRRGGWVVRLGDRTMPRLPRAPGVVDYATGPHKGDRLDVFLCAACRFFVGVASGLAHVPTTFGVPCLLTNWLSNALPVNSRHDLFLPKLVWWEEAGRHLTFDEYFTPEVRARFIMASAIREAGLLPVDNTASELRDAVIEMFDRLDGKTPDPADEDRQRRFAAVARRHGLIAFSRVSGVFLKRHDHLLPEAEAVRLAG